jgi:hypothetical protein
MGLSPVATRQSCQCPLSPAEPSSRITSGGSAIDDYTDVARPPLGVRQRGAARPRELHVATVRRQVVVEPGRLHSLRVGEDIHLQGISAAPEGRDYRRFRPGCEAHPDRCEGQNRIGSRIGHQRVREIVRPRGRHAVVMAGPGERKGCSERSHGKRDGERRCLMRAQECHNRGCRHLRCQQRSLSQRRRTRSLGRHRSLAVGT